MEPTQTRRSCCPEGGPAQPDCDGERACLPSSHIPSLEQRWIQRVVKPLRFLSLSPLFSFLLSVFYSFPFGSCGLMLP